MKITLFFALLCFSCARLPAAEQKKPAEQKGPRLGSDLRVNLAKQKSGSRKFKLEPASAAEEKPAPQVYCIYGAQSGKPFGDIAAFKSVIWKNDVVYLGGRPDRRKDQEARLSALKAMREARGSKIAVAFEALDFSLQPVLDDYTSGKISEDGLRDKTSWDRTSGADFALYRPLFNFIAQNKLLALALNTPRETIFKIEREGPAALNDTEKKFLPEPISATRHKKYLEFLKTSFGALGAAAAAGAPTWENYLAAVSSWNEAAGAKIADFLNANPGWSVLVIAGNDRIRYNAAVPASVKSRAPRARQASFYAEDAENCPSSIPKGHKDLANYIWYSTTTVTGNQ